MNGEYPKERSIETVAKEDKAGIVEALGLTTASVDELGSIMRLKIKGTINSYDFLVMNNVMSTLTYLDLSEATIVYNAFEYTTGCHTENNQFPSYAFSSNKLFELQLPKSITSIAKYALYGQSSLTSIEIPKGVVTIEDDAFASCYILSNVSLPTTLKNIGGSAFSSCSKLEKITLPDNLESIGNYAFERCSNLREITLPNSVTSLGGNAFRSCGQLSNIVLSENLKIINSNTFNGCSNLKEISLPHGLTTIYKEAFRYSGLTSIQFPSSIEEVKSNAFYGCSSLKDIYTSVVEPFTIVQNTFDDVAYQDAILHIQEVAYDNYFYNTQWSQFIHKEDFSAPYKDFYLVGDYIMTANSARLNGETNDQNVVTPPDADLRAGSGLVVEGSESQDLDEVHVAYDGSSNSASIIGEGTQDGDCNININKLHIDIAVNANKWYFLTFPFDINLSDITYDGSHVWRTYDGALRATNGNGAWQNVSGNKLIAGKGYIFQGNKAGTLTLTVPNVKMDSENRIVSLAEHVADNTQNSSWNFVGNPYLNYYDIADLDYGQPITVWNGSSYVAYRSGDDNLVLHPFQAFFVQKPDAVDAITFDAECRKTKTQSESSAATVTQYRMGAQGTNTSRMLINLTLTDGNATDRTRVVFNDNARATYETECDAAKFMADGVPQLYSMDADKVMYAINERPVEKGVVALGYKAINAGEYTIAATRTDVGVMLKDNLTGATHNLSNGSYTFTSDAGTFDNRFSLVMTGETTDIKSADCGKEAVVETAHNRIIVSNANGLKTTVVGADGVTAGYLEGNGAVNVTSGIYIVTVGEKTQKVIVK